MVKKTPEELGIHVPSWRPGQWEAIQNSVGSKKRFVVHNMPTGGGKSIVGVGEARLRNSRTLILTGTKALQRHYSDSFKNLNILEVKGKSNYYCRATELGGEFYDGSSAKFVSEGPCQFGVECGLKANGCTYYDTIRKASTARMVVSNYAAWISSNLYADGWGNGFQLIICDEAHEAEKWLSTVLSIQLAESYVPFTGRMPRGEDTLEWKEWAEEVYPHIRRKLMSAMESNRSSRGRVSIKSKAMVSTLRKLEMILARLVTITEDWLVYREKEVVHFSPVWVHSYAGRYLFNGAAKVVLMSATIVPYEMGLLGIAKDKYDYFEYPSSFPVKNRPIYYYPVVRMHHGMDAEDNLSWINVADDFISRRLDRKGIIHTVSFARLKALMACSQFASLMAANLSSATAMATLQKFRAAKPPAILVTPSMGTGVDLPGKQAEYAIIPKIPFENISDPMLMARSAEDPEYGIFQASKKLLQMTGRIVRSDTDHGETLITDQAFDMLRGKYKYMLPSYFWAAVKKVDSLPDPLAGL